MNATVRKNLMNVLRVADSDTTQKGLNWYVDAHNFAVELSDTFQLSFNNVCGIISALSPSCRWERNKLEATELIAYLSYGLNTDRLSFTTYGNNVAKAFRIFDLAPNKVENEFIKTNSGFKTHNFFKNIQNPFDPNYVTIDRHAYFIYNGMQGNNEVKLTKNQYKAIAENYISFAKMIGVLPCQGQAILWETYQKIKTN